MSVYRITPKIFLLSPLGPVFSAISFSFLDVKYRSGSPRANLSAI